MRRFRTAWPDVEIELRESHLDSELADCVERGELDLSFVQLPLENPSLETLQLLRDDYVLVSSRPTRRSPPASGRRRCARSPSSR